MKLRYFTFILLLILLVAIYETNGVTRKPKPNQGKPGLALGRGKLAKAAVIGGGWAIFAIVLAVLIVGAVGIFFIKKSC